MSEQISVWNRIAGFFRAGETPGERPPESDRSNGAALQSPPQPDGPDRPAPPGEESRPAASSPDELLGALRDHLAAQDRRQEEMASRISHVASVLESPRDDRQGDLDALARIVEHLDQQAARQAQLAERVDTLAASSVAQRELLDALQSQLRAMAHQQEVMTETLRKAAESAELAARHGDAAAQAVRKMQETASQRDARFEPLVRTHNARSTAMLVAAVILSLLAAAAAAVVALIHLRG